MSRFNAFHPIWPPASCDDFDDFDDLPEMREPRGMFDAQMICLGEMVEQAAQSPTGSKTHYLSQEIAALLHNISGTAAYFGAAEFGTFASELEQPVRAAFTADLLRPLCARIQASLTPTRID